MRKKRKGMRRTSSQALVLFNDVLDGEKLLQSPEIKKLIEYFYGNYELSVVRVENPGRLHDWFRDEQYKADVQGCAMIYPVKARFLDWTSDTHSEEFSGPLYVQVFTPDEAVFHGLTITCHWSDGVFRNDDYVVGAIMDTDDLKRFLDSNIQR